MTEATASYRRILKSSSIIGGASVFTILIGLVRTKVLAVLLGPTGVGLVSLYGAVISTAAVLSSMGLGTVGTRQVAEAAGKQDDRALAVTRRAMFGGMTLLAGMGALAVWSLREILALHVLGDAAHANSIGWLALGVALSVAATSQGALLQGMRRIGDMAQLSIFSTVLTTVAGVAMLWQWGKAALVAYILLGPLISCLVGYLYVSRVPKQHAADISLDEIIHQWRAFFRLGIAFMGAGVAASLIQFWIRLEVSKTLGTDALGYFQAAWTISLQYVGLVLGAMGADYYPRLTAVIHDRAAAARLVNEQTEIALLLSAPILIGMMALSPWIIGLLYSTAFLPAANVLRWQILGDVLKVASWPLGFLILAAGQGKTYFWTETSSLLIMGLLIAGLIPVVGLEITGIAFAACYAFYLPLVFFLARRRIGFRWSNATVALLTATVAACIGVASLTAISRWGELFGCLLAIAFGLYALRRLWKMSDLAGSENRVVTMLRQYASKIGL